MISTRMARSRLGGGLAIGIVILYPVLSGCTRSDRRWALTERQVALPTMTGKEQPVRRPGTPAEMLAIREGGDRTVLLHGKTRYRHEARWQSRAFVIVLDGPPQVGNYEVTPENGRLIQNSPWLPAREPYNGLEGTITILEVDEKGVLADCSVRNLIRRSGDRVYALRGRQRFRWAPIDYAELTRCAIQVD